MIVAKSTVYKRDDKFIVVSYWKAPTGISYQQDEFHTISSEAAPSEVGRAVVRALEHARVGPESRSGNGFKVMLSGLKIRSHRQFIQGNRSVSVSERDDGTLVVRPMITDSGAKSFLYPENDEETVRTDDRSASGLGEIILERFEHTREA